MYSVTLQQIFPPVPIPNEPVSDNAIDWTASLADPSVLLIDLTRPSSLGNISTVNSPAEPSAVSLIDLTGSLDDVSMVACDDSDLVIDLASSDSDGDEK
jgi:hypothetical protein